MYARELRKWSLKYQMSYLWLSAMVTLLLLSVYCPNATSMHLPIDTNSRDTALRITPAASGSSHWLFDRPNASNSNRVKSKQTKSDSSSSYISSSSISNTNTKYYDSYNPLAVFSGLRNHNARAKAPVNANAAAPADNIDVADSINHNNHNINSNSNINIDNNNNNNNNNNNYYVPNVPNSNSQINLNFKSYAANSLTKSAYDNSNSRSNKLRRHTNQSNANYHSPVRVAATFHHQPAEIVSAPSPSPPLSPSPLPSSLPSSPPIPIKFIDREERRQLLQQQSHNRTMLLAAAAAARSRRDSAYGYLRNISSSAASSASSYQHQLKHHQNHNSRNNNNNNNNNNRRNNSNNNINNNNNHRKRQRRYCSARDPAQLAFEAPTVVESKIVSMEADRLANFAVSFAVQKVFKRQVEFSLKRNDYMRLQFTQRNTSGGCDIYRESLRSRGLVRSEELEQGRLYILFVQQMDQSNFKILGQPIRRTQRVIESVMKAVREDYAQLASIRSITASNRTGEIGRELQIVCKVQGQPPPKVTWFKDHKSINKNRMLYQFNHYKKKSELIIKSFNVSDAGIYECRAKNKVNKKVEKKNIVIKAKKQRNDVSTQQSGEKCPEDVSEFCFNGGTCKFFMEIHSYSCICTEGFIGERCDRKEMPPIPTYKTGYIADDPNVDDATDIESDENDEDDEDDDFIYPPTKDSTYNKFT